MDLSVKKTTTTLLSDKSWIYAGRDGSTQNMLGGTLDLTLFVAEDHYPDGSIRSGTVLARVDATDVNSLLGPYDPAALDDRDTALGLLFEDTKVSAGQTRAGCAVFHDGPVVEANLPATSGIDTDAKTALTHITFN